MKKGTFGIKKYSKDKEFEIETVAGLVSKFFGLHKYNGYKITHIPTGLAIPVKNLNYSQSKRLIVLFENCGIDWSLPEHELIEAGASELTFEIYQGLLNNN